jgi:calcineurin-like phosphoesterase family protein
MNTFFTSDLHIGHTNIIEFSNRPFLSVEEMNLGLLNRWNEVVSDQDTVIIVGDLAMGKLDESLAYVEFLNGHKHLVPGNHDRMFGCWGEKYAKMAQRYYDAGIEMIFGDHFTLVCDADGRSFDVCHFPFKGESREQHEDRYQNERPKDHGQRLLHGHTHGVWRKSGRMVDVGVDAWGGRPVPLEDVVAAFDEPEDFLAPISW